MKWLLLLALLSSCSVSKKPEASTKVRITAYHSKEKDHTKYKNKSAAGTTLKVNRSIAADWSIWPLGTLIKFNNNIYEVDDYGSYILTCPVPTIDLYVDGVRAMKNWGTRFCNIEVVKMGNYAQSAEILKDRLHYSHCRVMFDKIQQKL